MEFDAVVVVHERTEADAKDTVHDVAESMEGEKGFAWMNSVGRVEPVPDGWMGSLEESEYLDLIQDSADENLLAKYLFRQFNEYQSCLERIRSHGDFSELSGPDVFESPDLIREFRKIAERWGEHTYVYDQRGDGVSSVRDLKYALSSEDFVSEEKVRKGARPFAVKVSME